MKMSIATGVAAAYTGPFCPPQGEREVVYRDDLVRQGLFFL